jgi:hypothetical protein
MIKFLRISSIYSGFIDEINKKINFQDNYENILNSIFKEQYSVSNYITEELSKKNYQCHEVIHNYKLLQDKWLEKYAKQNNEETILQQIRFYNPDVLFIGDINLLNELIIKKIKKISNVKLVLCFHCAPFKKKQIEKLKEVDGIITCTKGYKEKMINFINKDIHIMYHAYKNDENKLKDNNGRNIDVGFVGSLFLNKSLHTGRIDIVYELIKKYKNNYVAINFSRYFFIELFYFIFKLLISFKVISSFKTFYKILYIYIFSKKAIYGKNMYRILKKTKILINKHIEDTEFAGNMRLFEATGSGCLLITDNKKDIDKFFNINEEVVVFNDKEDLIDKINFYLNSPGKLKNIADNGKKKTITVHNYKNRVNELDIFIKKKLAEYENI